MGFQHKKKHDFFAPQSVFKWLLTEAKLSNLLSISENTSNDVFNFCINVIQFKFQPIRCLTDILFATFPRKSVKMFTLILFLNEKFGNFVEKLQKPSIFLLHE